MTRAALERLYASGRFRLLTGHQVIAIRKGEVELRPNFARESETVTGDTVVWAPIRKGSAELEVELISMGAKVARIGDALAGRDIQAAIREGHLAARRDWQAG